MEDVVHVGFTGTRKGMSRGQRDALLTFLKGANQSRKFLGAVLHHGDCVGADAEANEVADSLGMCTVIHPPENPKHRAWCEADEYRYRKPYLERNRDIVDECDFLVAAPGGKERRRSGTWATVRYARKQGKQVVILERGSA